ncbi:MAG: ABC transporter permease [Anaerolineae bacterium]|nr:ABC transporter permease [Anaerolineae bacterium]
MNLDLVALAAATLRISAPLIMVGMAGLLSYQVGLINIALEGMMLSGAFAAVVIGHEAGLTWIGVVMAAVVGAALGALFALAVVTLRANLIVSGLALNFLAIGGTAYLMGILYDKSGTFAPEGMDKLPAWDIPLLKDVPYLGEILSGHSPLVYASWILIPITSVFLYRMVVGGHLRAVGEHAEAAETAGISVWRMQYLALMLGGALCGLAGAHLSVGDQALFREKMTNDRGFIALAAVYFAAARPGLTAVACLLFGFFEALQFRLQLQNTDLPNEFLQMTPYLMVVIALTVMSARKEWRKGW